MQLFYATRDGQSRRIAERLCEGLVALGMPIRLMDLGVVRPTESDFSAATPIILVAAVRYGKHLPEAELFLTAYCAAPSPAPLILLSVNLTARKPGKDSAEGNVYLRKTIKRHGLRPLLARAIAGRLDYARYRWLDRHMIRFIMLLTGGPTDPNTRIEYTNWDGVDQLVREIAGLSPTS